MIDRDKDLLEWCIESDGLTTGEIEKLGQHGDLDRMKKIEARGHVEHTADDWWMPTRAGVLAVSPN
jgi:hypothetical protein